MDLRDSKSRLILIVVALGAALVVAVASCSGGGGDSGDDAQGREEASEGSPSDDGAAGEESPAEEEPEDDEPGEVLAEVSGEVDLTLAVTRAEREEGGFLTLEGTLHNGGSDGWLDLGWSGPEQELDQNGFSMAGATVVARTEGKRYLILRDTTGRCLCTGFGEPIDPGATVSWFAQFPEPEASTSEIEFQVGNMPPATVQIR
ncbi:hypothetical protein [Streptomyces avicenniae]|uniref:hypothetical protein n=1 Tax=Streptomyces avicenniae TaxID=500153 RepID=UPI00069AF485|nr:hypothetical protein [Streptomyces avicenniae]